MRVKMKRKRNVWYSVTFYGSDEFYMYCPKLKKWIIPDNRWGYYCSSHYDAKTMSGALKMCSKLDMNMPKNGEILLTQFVIVKGKRMAMDYTYRRKNK